MYLCQFFLSSIENIVCHNLRQHRTIPALRLKHRSGSCGTASALPKCSIMSGCGTRHRASGAKAPRTLRPLPLLRFAVSATGGAHLCSIQYYLRFWLGICRTSLTVSALRIMRYCHKNGKLLHYKVGNSSCALNRPPGPNISKWQWQPKAYPVSPT